MHLCYKNCCEKTTCIQKNCIKNNSFCKQFDTYFKEYSSSTTIHGFHYLTESKTPLERTFWIILLLSSLIGCIYMIYEILSKYYDSPVVVSFATEDTSIFEIPFPAVTICPETKYSRENFNYSQLYFKIREDEDIDEEDLKKFYYLSLICDDGQELNITNKIRSTLNITTFYETIDQLKANASSMLLFCGFMDMEYKPCTEMFTPVFIDKGICYSFNIIGRHEIFRNHVTQYKDYYRVDNNSKDDFYREIGYNEDAGVNTYPRRALMAGVDNSLKIFFKYSVNNSDFMCNNFFQGFRILIHNPWDVPLLSKRFFSVPFDKVVLAALEPELTATSATVRRFKPKKRNCYMIDERPLRYFQEYSQKNCELECLTNYTLEKCGCVQFFMPRTINTSICGVESTGCSKKAESELKIEELKLKILEKSLCDCKPSCTNLNFKVDVTLNNFYYKKFFDSHPDFANETESNQSRFSVLTIYFTEEQFMTKVRNELYGITDLISSLGGLLSLFTGFSLISLVEIFYFCSFRVLLNNKLYGNWYGKSN